MAGDFGRVGVENYAHNFMTGERIEKLENSLAAWLATKPGSFSSRDACGCYDRALARFESWSGRSDIRDDFEIALARAGFRAGTLVFNGDPFWILVLPSSVDAALERMAAAESRPA